MSQEKAKDVVVLLSGGMDSACCIQFALDAGADVHPIHVAYAQPSQEPERVAAKALSAHYGLRLQTVEVGGLVRTSGSIPGRNAMLALVALAAFQRNPHFIALGIHSGTPYFDCSRLFIDQLQAMIDGYTDGVTRLMVPFLDWTKPDVLSYAKEHRVPIDLTYSCERGETPVCGQCSSCLDRKALDAL